MRDGLYKIHFKTQLGEGFGVATLLDGTIRGGDSAIYYTGTFTVIDNELTADVKTARYATAPGITSVFGRDNVHIQLRGKTSETSANVTGHAKEAPNVTFQATLTRLDD